MLKGRRTRIPLRVKLVFTAFMAVLVPVYLHDYGPSNFLYFCDVALMLTLAGAWLENALLLSVAAVGILVAQTLWLVDFALNAAGLRLTGMTDYMFDADKYSLFLRALSLFHGWLPLLLLYLLHRTGYDARALPVWTALATVLVLVSYFCMPAPASSSAPRVVNINYVYGLSDAVPQRWVPAWVWLVGVSLVGFPVVLYVPAHVALSACMPPPKQM